AADPPLRRARLRLRPRLRAQRGAAAPSQSRPLDLARLRGLQRRPRPRGAVTVASHAVAPAIGPGVTAARVPLPVRRGVGLRTGWGDGPPDPHSELPQGARGLIPVSTPALPGERFRRATRECLLAVAATHAAVTDAGLDPAVLAGDRTGSLYLSAPGHSAANPAVLAGARTGILSVGATGSAAPNRACREDEASTTLHFPYPSPSSGPAEVTIEFGGRGPYVTLRGGAPAALQGLWYAARWLATG